MKYGKPILALLSLFGANPSTILRCWRISKRNCRLLYVHSNRCFRCFRIQTSGFTSWLHDVLHCLVFKEHPRFPPARCAFRESASIYYLIRFGLSRTFWIYFRKLSKPLGIQLSAAFALVAVCRRLVIYYTVVCSLSMAFCKVFCFTFFSTWYKIYRVTELWLKEGVIYVRTRSR